jgi:divalent metal cation (Fe/Co/Zn/Cd) transporter
MKAVDRPSQLQRGLALEMLTVGWNIVEGVIAVAAGIMASSIALVGFGVDSFIETASGIVVGWRLAAEIRGPSDDQVERLERVTARVAGGLLLVLAVYLVVESVSKLFGSGTHPVESRLGIAITVLSLIVMSLLGRAKLNCATALESAALRADAFETFACAWLSATTLAGLALNFLFRWWWTDPLAALVMVPLIFREALEGLRGHHEVN